MSYSNQFNFDLMILQTRLLPRTEHPSFLRPIFIYLLSMQGVELEPSRDIQVADGFKLWGKYYK